MITDPVKLEELTESIIASAIAVHNETGPGLLESIYKTCLAIELRARGLHVNTERRIGLVYRDILVESHFVLDLVVEESVVVEVKAVTTMAAVYHAQVITYLKLTGCPVGLLLNFNVTALRNGLRRLVRPDIYTKKEGSRAPVPHV
jgi:GxxExxY protein